MVEIQSKEVIDKISDELKIQPSMQIPRELAKQIQLVYGVNPQRLIQVRNNTASDSTGATIFTTNSERDTFIVGVKITLAKSVLATSTNSTLRAIPFGESTAVFLARINYEPVTAGEHIIYINFPFPIKISRNSAVTINNGAAVASIDTSGVVYFYETDPQ